jgi:hypothetical protein
MATTQQTALQQLYVAYFNRPADPGGLAFYDANLTAGRVTMAQISADFAQSAEYQDEYDQATYAGVVDQVYMNLFGRPADSTGKALYVKALNDKTMTIGEMVTWISNGAQGTDKEAFAAKVAVAAAFTDALNTPAEVAGYNEDAQAAAKALLATIKTTTAGTTAVAAIDTHVAAAIKAGVEFTLQTGLADLAAAQEARADFLEAFGEANEIENADEDSVAGAVDAAELALVSQIEDDGFATASPGVQAAMIDDQKELNADTLAAANAALKAAQAKVPAALKTAIAAATSAAAGTEEAEEAALDAEIAASSAFTNFSARNAGADSDGSLEDGDVVIKVGVTTVAEMKDGELVVADKVDASKYAGLTALVAAYNEAIAANADLAAAEDAQMFADLRVEMLDLESTTVLNGAFTFKATTVTTPNKPTYNQIVDELSALTSKSVAADAALAAKPTDAVLQGNALVAAKAVEDFRKEITEFIGENDTPLANAVKAAEEGSMTSAQAAYDAAVKADASLEVAVDAYPSIIAAAAAVRAAEAANAALATAETKADTAATNYTTAANTFTGTNSDVTVDPATGLAVYDDAGTDKPLVVVGTGGTLVVAPGIDNADFPGIGAYLTAANARITADKELVIAQDAADDAAVAPALLANDDVIENLADAMSDALGTTVADRAAALGTKGAQTAIDNLAEAQEDLETANAAADQLKSLDKAITDAEAEFAANDYNAPSMLNAASAFGTTGSDIFVVNKVDSTITSFGRSGEDVLFIGNGYTLNTGDFAKDGKDDVLEVFFVQSGNNTVVTIETKAFGSNSQEAEIKITLTGVDADDLQFSNGIISI